LGIDKNDRQFVGYSKEYMDSLAFKIGRKTSQVNLKLSGDMLQSIEVIAAHDGAIIIGFTDSAEIPKAHNHITGDTLPKRDFLGLPKDELNAIINEFPPVDQAKAFERFAEKQQQEIFKSKDYNKEIEKLARLLTSTQIKSQELIDKELQNGNPF
jgi:predicted ATP-dependent Lon-type protease